jgi:EpsI family protein
MNRRNAYITIAVLLLTIVIAFCLPKPRYESPDIFSLVSIPERLPEWVSKDVSGELNTKDDRYRFISDIFARNYFNTLGRESLLFMMLDAGNFHNPKVCFGASGFKVEDLGMLELDAQGKMFQAYAVYAGKDGEGTLIIYWITINQSIVNWTEQKLQQFWYSILNKQKIGLMIRVDIPTKEDRIESSLLMARRFVRTLAAELPEEEFNYIFGKETKE